MIIINLNCGGMQEHDTTQCGFAYSTADQVAYCPVEEPPIWPALLQLPEDQYTGGALQANASTGDALNITSAPMLYTGNDRASADALMAALFAREQSLGKRSTICHIFEHCHLVHDRLRA